MVSREEKLVLEEKLEKKKKRKRFLIISLIVFLFSIITLFCYMRFVGTKGLVVHEYKVVNKRLPESFHGFKIVHFSDLHYLSTVSKKDLGEIITTINKLKPDIVVFTGDLTDQDTKITSNDLNDLTNLFNRIQVTTGMYAIRGNHDYATNNFDIVFNQTDFKVLSNSYDLIYYHSSIPILITGTGSSIQNDFDIGKAYSYNDLDSIYTLSLIHEPDSINEIISTNQVDLALAGHSHGGQIRMPWVGAVFKPNGAKNYPNDHYKIRDTDLYVSSGLGTSEIKLRYFNHPSINLYRLVEK